MASDGGVCESSPAVAQNLTIPDFSHPGKLGIMGVVLALEVILPPLFVLFFWRAKTDGYAHMGKRPFNLVMTTALGIWVHALVSPLAYFTSMNCGFHLFVTFLLPPMIGGPLLMRILLFVQLTRFHYLAAKNGGALVTGTGASGVRTSHGWRQSSLHPSNNVKSRAAGFFANRAEDIFLIGSVVAHPIPLLCGENDDDKNRTLLFLRFLRSKSGTTAVISLIELPFVVAALSVIVQEPVYISGCVDCHILYGHAFTIFATMTFVIFALFVLFFVYAARMPDKWGFRKETMLCLLGMLVAALGFFMAFYWPVPPGSVFDWQEVQALGFLADLFFATVYQVHLAHVLEPHHRRSHRSGKGLVAGSSFTSSAGEVSMQGLQHGSPGPDISLDDVLDNAELAKRFEQHLVSEFGVESLLFLRAAKEYKDFYNTRNDVERIAASKLVYSTYIHRNGLFPINIPGSLADSITKQMDGVLVSDEVPPISLLDEAVEEISHLLTHGALKRFPWRKGSLVLAESPLGV